MVASLLTALLFAASGICGRRAAVAWGALPANACRLALAALMLGIWVYFREPVDASTRAFHRLLVSGAVGFGLGDTCLFLAYPRIGARLTILVNLCSAPVFGALLDWRLTGTAFSFGQLLASAVILFGVMLALHGFRTSQGQGTAHHGREWFWGIGFALLAGLGQGLGAALSRHAHAAMVEDGTLMTGVAQAFVRLLPGVVFAGGLWLLVSLTRRSPRLAPPVGSRPVAWLIAAVLCGPVFGVSCFQWALGLQSSIVVLSITATAPLLIMPMSAIVDQDRPGSRAVVGAAVAVVGVVLMLWVGRR